MKQAHPLQRRVLKFIHQEQLISNNDSILVAVSGGPDSVALLHILLSLRSACGIGQIGVLHFNHQLRGKASEEDRAFVEALAETFGIPCHAGSEDVRDYQRRHRISLEMAARACRQRFFKDALRQIEIGRIALGHTANDQAEEILLRLFRGTGPSGMSGMPPKTGDGIIRPLLLATRQEILTYLDDHELGFREDLSNGDTTIQRNALRHRIVPAIENHFHPRAVEVLCRHARLAADENSYWSGLLADEWRALGVEETPSRIQVASQRLLNLHPALCRRLLRLALERLGGNLQGIYAVHIQSLYRLLTGKVSGRSMQLPGWLRATLDGGFFVLSREPPGALPDVMENISPTIRCPGQYCFSSFEFHISLREPPPPDDLTSSREGPDSICLDADTIKWPLFLRSWKSGDRFRPLGLGGTKKLQDFFVDCKIPRSQRGRIPLLCDQEKICWVVGHRLDDRVKVTPQTRQVLIIERRSQHPALST
jgi:tRNA(Ile)-lysidine synthase